MYIFDNSNASNVEVMCLDDNECFIYSFQL